MEALHVIGDAQSHGHGIENYLHFRNPALQIFGSIKQFFVQTVSSPQYRRYAPLFP